VAPTGVAAFNVNGYTLHSLLSLPTRGEFKDLEGESLKRMQQSLGDMEYLIIDEMSMLDRKMFGKVDRRLRQVFPHRSGQVLGGCSCLLIGDFGQLPQSWIYHCTPQYKAPFFRILVPAYISHLIVL
jgi:ATP-dependent DNA helicase PIF1